MNKKVLFISIKPEYANKILSGEKRIELRKSAPKVQEGDLMVIYASSPTKAIVGYCSVVKVIIDQPKNLWSQYNQELGINQNGFDEYYQNTEIGAGIVLTNVKVLNDSIRLDRIKKIHPNFSPPQSYRYFSTSRIIRLFKSLVDDVTLPPLSLSSS